MTVTTETIRTAARSSYELLGEFRGALGMRVVRPLDANAHQAIEAGYRICERLRSTRDRITALRQDSMQHWRLLQEPGELTFSDHRWLELVIAISYAHADDVRSWCRRYGDTVMRTNLLDAHGVTELNSLCPFPLTEDQLGGLSSELAEINHYLLRGVVYGEAAPRAGREDGYWRNRTPPEDNRPASRETPLTESDRDILQHMLEQEMTHDKPGSQSEIVKASLGTKRTKDVFGRLKKNGYIETRHRVGTWLTPAGIEAARRIAAQ